MAIIADKKQVDKQRYVIRGIVSPPWPPEKFFCFTWETLRLNRSPVYSWTVCVLTNTGLIRSCVKLGGHAPCSHVHEVRCYISGGSEQHQTSVGGSGGVPTLFPSLPGPATGLGFTTYCSRLWGAPFLPMIHRYPPLLPGPPEGTDIIKERGKLHAIMMRCESVFPHCSFL